MDYKRTEVGVIPEDWDICTLHDVIDKFVNGGTPPTKNVAFWSGDIPWITGADILNQTVAIIRRYITEEAVYNSSTNVIAKGNLLIVSRTGVGKLAIAPCDIAISQDFTGVILNKEKILAKYLFRYFDFCQHVLTKQNQGTSIKGITRDTLAAILIPLPPLHEQRAIAEALSDVDELLSALEELIAKKRAVKQAAMQQLLTGKTRLPGFRGKWETITLGDVADLKNGYAFKSSTYVSGGIYQIITIANVQNGHLSLDVANTISEFPLDLQDHQQLSYGDILISMTGNVGRVCIVKDTHCLLNQRVGKLMAKGIAPLFLYYIVHDRRFLRSMIEVAVGGAQGNLGKSRHCRIYMFPTEKFSGATCHRRRPLRHGRRDRRAGKRRDTTRAIKQGMMQELLIGRVRLV